MSASAFADVIIGKLSAAIGRDGSSYTQDTAPVAMQAVADGITEYLLANTTVTVAYSGTIPGPPPAPDPLVSDTFQIAGACAPTGPSSHFDEWISLIENNIISGFQLAPMGAGGLVFSIMPFLNKGVATTQETLKASHDVTDESPQKGVWQIVCQGIMDWLNSSAKNPAASAATHPAASSAGTASITSIVVS